jgi:hypothetical protein
MAENIENLLILDIVLYSSALFFYFYQFKEINAFIGYKTKRSTKNLKSWLFAQEFFFKRWFILIIPITFLSQLPLFFDKTLDLVPLIGFEFIIHSIISIYMTEKKLKEFQKND